ncbi:hypothetical protein [Catenovulum adriaticum]|uniref:Phosphate ABC transporter substrate-binding protein n=1 Tax=Catenovulum adriaticum TaxID=2984846 RepID=A0ABY7AJH9_9ALTE|nr:hypothetical protein [Catenovulum sp. TS8]WAJ69718.1 hypothetical protein OLW01_11205 [Catenovulum sp. TS8]
MRLPRFFYSVLFISLGLMSKCAFAGDILVIVHPDNPTQQLSSGNVLDIYTGRLVAFPGGTTALPVDLSNETQIKADFYQQLMGKSLSQMSSYWAKLLFTGRYSPPVVLDPPSEVIAFVSENLYAVGYIDEAWLTDDVKVVYRLKSI